MSVTYCSVALALILATDCRHKKPVMVNAQSTSVTSMSEADVITGGRPSAWYGMIIVEYLLE